MSFGQGLIARLAASREVQRQFNRIPGLRWLVAREGSEIFDLVQGFVRSQVLAALVDLDIFAHLADGAARPEALAPAAGLSPERMTLLLNAGVGIGVLRRSRDGRFSLTRRGAALSGVPGLVDMIRHHRAFYADMADPVALLRGAGDTELSRFWPYVFGAEAAGDADDAARYSDLMAQSQVLVAEDTLAAVSLARVRCLLDVGGGSGAFLEAAGRAAPELELRLFDLPAVVPMALARFEAAGMAARFRAVPGSFRDAPLPSGADAVSLVRVLYDHDDATVRDLLAKAFDALPPGGRLIVSEPMSGGTRPDPATDVYFAFYTLAMTTGRTRSADEISQLMRAAGFTGITRHRSRRPFVTSVVSARRGR